MVNIGFSKDEINAICSTNDSEVSVEKEAKDEKREATVVTQFDNLSRSYVQSLIQNNTEFSTPEGAPMLTSGARMDGVSQGYWDNKGGITSKGKKVFIALQRNNLAVREGLRREVTGVTGIADSVSSLGGATGGLKEAYFQWKYSNVKGLTRRFIVSGGIGVASVRLYDDGWRIDKLNIQEGKEGFMLSSAELIAAEKDRQSERTRRQAEQDRLTQEAEQKRRDKERRDQRIVESKKINRTLGSFACLDNFTGRKHSDNKITLNDTGFKYECGNPSGSEWYGNIKQYRKTTCTQTAMGWTKPCVVTDLHYFKWIVFENEAKRNSFFIELSSAITNWRSKYPDL